MGVLDNLLIIYERITAISSPVTRTNLSLPTNARF